METGTNRRIVLAKRPSGLPDASCFRLENVPVPEPAVGEMLLRTLWVSVDPHILGRMGKAVSNLPKIKRGEVIVGGTVSEVLVSQVPGFTPGDIVSGYTGWQEYAIARGDEPNFFKVDPLLAPVSTALSVLGLTGHTAYFGMREVGKPVAGETVVVSAAAGAVGSTAGQIAKIAGCRVVGIAGSDEKCAVVQDVFGFDACVNYRSPTFTADLHAACPDGVDVYFENVGGTVMEAVLPLLNSGARVPVCGFMAGYGDTGREPVSPLVMLAENPMPPHYRFFVVTDYAAEFPAATRQLGEWLREGKLTYRETIIDGLENTPKAFIGLFHGANVGKMLVKVA